ncbi:hypothetical protein cypCar_00011262 [Cyprinus carpio]|nr:hypothetical protein cypCar_00011262 [Cyprinus carpio]
MRESPRRPIILKRRKLPFQKNESDAGCDEADGPRCKTSPTPSTARCFPDGIRMMDHPTMPDTQVVVIPKAADLQSVISALTAKGKECGPQGRNKFILLSASTSLEESKPLGCLSTEPKGDLQKVKKETECFPLDDSLTNIHWLGKMSSDGLGSESNQKCTGKDNPSDCHQNSIRHNLSLHDMFVRETSLDGKISYWTIRPEANRCLTLDQVYKPLVGPVTPTCPQIPQVGFIQQQKRGPPELKRAIPAMGSTERKMKPLLPRTDSYLVPIQLPLGQSLFLPSSSPATLVTPPHAPSSSTPSSGGASKRVRIAPKVSQSDMSSVMLCASSTFQDIKEEPASVSVTPEAPEALPSKTRQQENSSSRRKQRLVLPATEEPVLLYPDSTLFDSGVVSDASTFQDTHDPEPQLSCKPDAESPNREYTFKTPIKSTHPSSSTPSKLPTVLEPWRITPVGKGGVLDFSPIRTPSGPQLTPQRHGHTPFSFNSTPFKELPLFSSPRELLTCSRPSPRRSTPTCSRELLQEGAANRSFTEGLVLDTMNDSLSKILVDISFPNLEDDDLGMANISWSQFIPELK